MNTSLLKDLYFLKDVFRSKEQVYDHKYPKKKPPKVTQSYVFPKIETLGTSINIPVNGHF